MSKAKASKFELVGKKIDLIVYDFDGVMTDNTAIVDETGNESVVVNRSDGLAIKVFKSAGIQQVIISTERNKVVAARAVKLDIPVLQGIDNKKEALTDYCYQKGLKLDRVIYIGNDVNDVPAMKLVGYPMAPQDAYPEAKKIATFVIPASGGKGVVRELLNHVKIKEA
ncbi:MAG: KdsC family phosphatase [Candidatus Kryptoniota bacterium]